MQHPSSLIAFAILRDGSGGIVSYAGFRVTKRPRHNYRFDLFHEAFANGQGDPLVEMRSLIPEGCLVIGETPGEDTCEDVSQVEQYMLAALPMLGATEPAGTSSFVMQGFEQKIQGLGEAFGIPLAEPDAPRHQQARRLAGRAQALWLAFTVTNITGIDRRQVIAAFQAHQALKAARPVPF